VACAALVVVLIPFVQALINGVDIGT